VTSAATPVDDHGGPWPKPMQRVMMAMDALVVFLGVLPETRRNVSV